MDANPSECTEVGLRYIASWARVISRHDPRCRCVDARSGNGEVVGCDRPRMGARGTRDRHRAGDLRDRRARPHHPIALPPHPPQSRRRRRRAADPCPGEPGSAADHPRPARAARAIPRQREGGGRPRGPRAAARGASSRGSSVASSRRASPWTCSCSSWRARRIPPCSPRTFQWRPRASSRSSRWCAGCAPPSHQGSRASPTTPSPRSSSEMDREVAALHAGVEELRALNRRDAVDEPTRRPSADRLHVRPDVRDKRGTPS